MTITETYPQVELQKKFFKEYTYLAKIESDLYHLLVIPVTKSSILTINSQYMWEIKYGKQVGSRFRTTSSKLLDLKKFQLLNNKMIAFKGKPYKIYKHINESDLIDISDTNEIFDIKLFNSIK